MVPLKDIVVLDLTQFPPWEFSTLVLAVLGAEVIKVEQPSGSASRALPPSFNGKPLLHEWFNRGKRSVAVDLKRPEGREVLMRLVERADVLVEAYTTSTAKKLGLDHRSLSERNGRLILCSVRAFDGDDPDAGHDVNVLSMTGALSLMSEHSGRPVIPGLLIADYAASYAVVVNVLAALHERQRTNRGMHVEVTMSSAVLPFFYHQLAAALALGRQLTSRDDPLRGAWPCYNAYQTSDGKFITVGMPAEAHLWRELCVRVSRPDLIDRQFDGEAVAELAEVFRSKSRDEWAEELRGVRCVTPVLEVVESVKGGVVSKLIENPERGLPMPMTPFGPIGKLKGAPVLGEDTTNVLSSLGYSGSEIERLAREGVVRVS
ncbi:MAG: CoA transferase [Thaumarchaeota archaeon]|nr:CoA transferase [Candidatus Calditenuaceae archaeon]MDW8187213.1 CaiB/BaiF CoA-transferase family protein [Nitrososphaerota archaeon]